MLTPRGWLVIVLTVAFLAVGRLFAVPELYVMGGTLGSLLLAAMVFQRVTRASGAVTRELHPPRVYAGSSSRVDLRVENTGRRRSPVLSLRDPVSGTRGANLLVPPLRPGESTRAAYQLPTARRGILQVGPLVAVLVDPFGLTRTVSQAAELTDLTVFPQVDDIAPVPLTSGNDPMAGAKHPNALGHTGEDFYALRPYVVGDDLRRVHWRSSARSDDLLVRQDEQPWQGRTTVLVDVRASTNTPDSLELVVSAAASIVMACARRQDLVRLVATDGRDSGFAAGHAHVDGILEHLANIAASDAADALALVDRLGRSSSGGALVVLSALAPATDIDQIVQLRNRFGTVTLVHFEPSSWGAPGPAVEAPIGPSQIRVTGNRPFAIAWNTAMRAPRSAAAGPIRRAPAAGPPVSPTQHAAAESSLADRSLADRSPTGRHRS